MAKLTRQQRQKKYRHEKKKKQFQNRIKFYNGEPIKITAKIVPPTPNEYERRIKENINELNNANLNEVSDDQLLGKLTDILAFKTSDGHGFTSVQSGWRSINTPNLFRVRRCGIEPCHNSMNKESDAWNPPSEKIFSKGRLNREHESVLYVAEEIKTAINESKINVGDCFWLIKYNVVEPITVTSIAHVATDENDKYFKVNKVIGDFLLKEFTRDVKKGNENQYRISLAIATFYYPYNIYNFDGWSYPSVVAAGKFSVCLNPERAKSKLQVAYVLHCKLEISGQFLLNNVAIPTQEGNFKYKELNGILDI
jgi:RES domain-containing protein